MSHSLIGPSSASTWVHCSGAPQMGAMFPEDDDSQESREGTAAHEVGQDMILAYAQSRPRTLKFGSTTSNGVVITEEILESATVYADDVIQVMRRTRVMSGPNFGSEERVDCPDIHKQSFGTPDQFIFDLDNLTLHVWDFKHGHGIVEAFENWQCINYVNGLLAKFKVVIQALNPEKSVKVIMTIVQPRAHHSEGPVRRWETEALPLIPYFAQLHTAAQRAFDGEPKATSGHHCRYCRARHACKAAQSAAMTAIDITLQATPQLMDAAGVAYELVILRRAERAIKYRLSGVEQQAKDMDRAGQHLPGITRQDTKGHKKWTLDNETVINMGTACGLDIQNPKPITPTQALAAGMDKATVESMTTVPITGSKLVIDDGSAARKAFPA